MLIEQSGVAAQLYTYNRTFSPLPSTPTLLVSRPWERYARCRMGRWGYGRMTDQTAAEIYTRRNGNFDSLLASYTAKLEYEGKNLVRHLNCHLYGR